MATALRPFRKFKRNELNVVLAVCCQEIKTKQHNIRVKLEFALTWDAAKQVILARLLVLKVPLVLHASHAAGLHYGQPRRIRVSRGKQIIEVSESISGSCRMNEAPLINDLSSSLGIRGHGGNPFWNERYWDHMWSSKISAGAQTELIPLGTCQEGAEGGGVTDPGVWGDMTST